MPSLGSTRIEVTRTYLELRGPNELLAARAPREPVTLGRRHPIHAAEYLSLYKLVGARWHWRDRLAWPTTELDRYLGSPAVEVWTPIVEGQTAGYFELQRHVDDRVEIMYFGLAPDFIGRGMGGWLLTRAAEQAFAMGGRRVTLNTCTLDAPQALPNYLARGFRIVREEHFPLEMAAPPHAALA